MDSSHIPASQSSISILCEFFFSYIHKFAHPVIRDQKQEIAKGKPATVAIHYKIRYVKIPYNPYTIPYHTIRYSKIPYTIR